MKNRLVFLLISLALCLGAKAQSRDYMSNPDGDSGTKSSQFEGLRVGFGVSAYKGLDSESSIKVFGGKIQSSFAPQLNFDITYRFWDMFELSTDASVAKSSLSIHDSKNLLTNNSNLAESSFFAIPLGLSLRYVAFSSSLVQPYLGVGSGWVFYQSANKNINMNSTWRLFAETGLIFDISPYWYLSLFVKQDYSGLSNISLILNDNSVNAAQYRMNALSAGVGISYRF